MSTDFYSGRRVLVTGALGFIGSACVKRLQARGADVLGTGRRDGGASYPWRSGDLTDMAFTDRLIGEFQPEVVLHLAGRTNAGQGLDNVRPSLQANAVATVNLLSALGNSTPKARFVYCSSMEEPFRDYPGFGSPYGLSKWVGTVYARLFRELYDLSTICLRPMFVYGPGKQPADKLMPHMINTLLRGEKLSLKSAGRGMDWVFVDDVADAFVLVGATQATPQGPLDLGSGELRTIGDVASMIAAQLNVSDVQFERQPSDRGQEGSPTADLSTTADVLGWRPATDLAAGVAATVAWYRNAMGNG